MMDFKKLKIWRESYKLSIEIYTLTETFPSREKFGITSQIRRAATSVPINISEGAGKFSSKDMAKFLQIAYGSLKELECLVMMSKDLHYFSPQTEERILIHILEIQKMLSTYIKRIRNR